jgi:hypothetical protein
MAENIFMNGARYAIMGEQEDVVNELHKIKGVSEKCALGMYLLGIRKKADLKGKDPVAMYAELKARKDFYAEPCMQNMLKIAVAMAKKDAD